MAETARFELAGDCSLTDFESSNQRVRVRYFQAISGRFVCELNALKSLIFCLFLRFGEKYGEKNKGDFYMNNNKKETLYKYMFPEYPDVVSINQLRKMLGISRHLAYDLVTTQKIYSLRIGNSFKIPKVCVVDYIIENFGNLERNPADETTRT